MSMAQMYRDLVAAEKNHELREGEFTVKSFAEDINRSYTAARRRLRALLEDGMVEREERVIDGSECHVYWCVEESDEPE